MTEKALSSWSIGDDRYLSRQRAKIGVEKVQGSRSHRTVVPGALPMIPKNHRCEVSLLARITSLIIPVPILCENQSQPGCVHLLLIWKSAKLGRRLPQVDLISYCIVDTVNYLKQSCSWLQVPSALQITFYDDARSMLMIASSCLLRFLDTVFSTRLVKSQSVLLRRSRGTPRTRLSDPLWLGNLRTAPWRWRELSGLTTKHAQDLRMARVPRLLL